MQRCCELSKQNTLYDKTKFSDIKPDKKVSTLLD